MSSIDIQDKLPGCKNFHWYEFLWLDKWELYAHPVGQQYLNLVRIGQKAQSIRRIIGDKPMTITSGLRPPLYNSFVGGAIDSAHRLGRAFDFKPRGITAEQARVLITPHLASLGIRMARSSKGYIHIDDYPPLESGRYFLE